MSREKKYFFFGSQKKIIGSQEKFGSVGKQQTNNFLILASLLLEHCPLLNDQSGMCNF